MSNKPTKFSDKRKARTKKTLRRKPPVLKPIKRVLIVTEGSKTEGIYFDALLENLGLVSVDVKICTESDPPPMSVVNHALKLCEREGSYLDGGYSYVYCIFDRDTHRCYEPAKDKVLQINDNKDNLIEDIRAITSIPCFEIWFILHFGYFRKPIVEQQKGKSCGEMTVKELKKKPNFSDYEKSLKNSHLKALLEKTNDAVRNSKSALKDVLETGSENPSTLVHEVILNLEKIELDMKLLERSKRNK